MPQGDVHFLNGIVLHASERLGLGIKVRARRTERAAREFDYYEARALGFLDQMADLGVNLDDILAVAPVAK